MPLCNLSQTLQTKHIGYNSPCIIPSFNILNKLGLDSQLNNERINDTWIFMAKECLV